MTRPRVTPPAPLPRRRGGTAAIGFALAAAAVLGAGSGPVGLVPGSASPGGLPFLAAAHAQDAGGEEEIRGLAQSLGASDDAHRWDDAVRLAGFGPKAVPIVAEAATAEGATPAGRVTLARVLLQLADRARAADALLRTAEQEDAPLPLRVEAVRLLGQTTDDCADRVQRVLDTALDPRLRAACASTLWRVAKDADAKKVLRELLRSDAMDLRVEGATALAEIDDFGPEITAVLSQIRNEPTERGRLARALLEKDEWRKVQQPPVPSAAPSPNGTAPAGSGVNALLAEAARVLKSRFVEPDTIDDAKLWEGAAHGLVNALGDPYTVYQTIDERDDWTDNLTKEYGGIGAYVNFDKDGVFAISRPMFKGPAWKNGLKAGTRVLRIGDWDTGGHTTDEIVKRLRGPVGTEVKLLVLKPGWREPQEMSLVREQIKVDTVYPSLLPGGIGYILVDNFAKNTSDEFRSALADLERQGAKALVLDLRNNTGGYLRTAHDLGDLLLPKGALIVETKGREGAIREETYVARGNSTQWSRTVPLQVLVNEFSASASEILSGALKLNGRAKVVGTRTFGKGSVQNPYMLFTPPFAESFTDLNRNGAWDEPEWFEDKNGNGRRDPEERFYDADGNQKWSDGEPYVDRNGNGRFDAPSIKITIAKYYVGPKVGSFALNPHRKEMIVGNRRVFLGGIEPDLPVTLEDMEGWRAEEMAKLERNAAFDAFLGPENAHWTAHKAALEQMALALPSDPTSIPGFDAWAAKLDTKLSREDLALWLHVRIRDHASNEWGRRLEGDWSVDRQLQRAIQDLAAREDLPSVRNAPEYAAIRAKTFETPASYGAEELAKARPARSEE